MSLVFKKINSTFVTVKDNNSKNESENNSKKKIKIIKLLIANNPTDQINKANNVPEYSYRLVKVFTK